MANNFFRFKFFTIYQDRCAMKVGTDGVLIGAWTNFSGAESILDVGCGTGLISIMAAQRNALAKITGIDIDKDAIEQTKQNALETDWNNRIFPIFTDFSAMNIDNKYDVIVSNPPYFMESTKSPQISRSIARSCGTLNYKSLIDKSAKLLTDKGRLSIIFPAEYYTEVLEHAIQKRIFPERVARIRPLPHSTVKRIMVEFGMRQVDTNFEDIVIEISRHNYSDEYINLTKDFYLNM